MPDEQMWIDVGKLIREHVPDKNGKALPADLTSGSYEIRDLTDIGLVSLFEGKVIYDKTYGHAAYGCATCCDYQRPTLNASTLGIPYQGTAQNGVGAIQWCTDQYYDVSSYFMYGWKTGNTSIATVNYMGTYTGVGVGSATAGACGSIPTGQQRNCPAYLLCLAGQENVYPTVTIGSFSQNPILQGSTATVTVTVNGSATISLAIGSTGTGAAVFDSQGGSTTKTISGTTTVTIYGSAASSTTGDLTLTASYGATTLAYSNFSVTSGACTLGSENDTGSGTKTCPSTVTLQSSYTVSQYCPTCSYSCDIHADSAWTPSSGCSAVHSHTGGSLTGTETTSAPGTFSASDCNWHYSYFVTHVTNAQNVTTNYAGGSIGLKCTSHGGTVCP